MFELEVVEFVAMIVDRAQQDLSVKHADNVVGLAAPQWNPSIGAVEDFVDNLACRQVGIDGHHVCTMAHYQLNINVG